MAEPGDGLRSTGHNRGQSTPRTPATRSISLSDLANNRPSRRLDGCDDPSEARTNRIIGADVPKSEPYGGGKSVMIADPRRRQPRFADRNRPTHAEPMVRKTHRWRKMDSNLYGAFSCQVVVFDLLRVLCSEREGPFFIPSPTIRFAERAEGVKGPKR